jgi:hypothetical protein
MESGQAYQSAEKLEDVMPEHEFIEWSGINKSSLTSLRLRGAMPYTYLNKKCRLYFVTDILDLLKSNRMHR